MFSYQQFSKESGGISYPYIEIRKEIRGKGLPLKAVIFDFDGTISTLRQGWEDIMEPFMIEMISGGEPPDDELITQVKQYIDESTGIQTIFQMEWLANEVKRRGKNPNVQDAWWYKDEYNRRLLNMVKTRVEELEQGRKKPQDFIIKGAEEFVQALWNKGLDLYIASGTDHRDVEREAASLGLHKYFTQILGAPERRADCSKEAVMRLLIDTKGIKGEELMVVGDGKVEIALGVKVGALTLGVAADEVKRQGLNPAKRKRLITAGAHAIMEDFTCNQEILNLLFADI